MDTENVLYKTAELVRDAVGCYYFICLQCGKDFENLDDTVMHIEKYFYEPPTEENSVDALTTINEPDWISNDGDVETVVANIKKESFEEYEDYKLSIPGEDQGDGGQAENHPIYCPLCSTTLSHGEISLESHLMTVHHRTRNHAKIYECTICGRNTFTRSYDLERHKLTHARYVDPSTVVEPVIPSNNFESQRRNGDRTEHSVLLNILSQTAKRPSNVPLTKKQSPGTSTARICTPNKRYISTEELGIQMQPKKPKIQEEIVDFQLTARPMKTEKPSNFCSICRTSLSKKETLESHLIRVHHRNKSYAQVYECDVCGKNTFTRPYDLRRHQLIHSAKSGNDPKATVSSKVFKTEPKTDAKSVNTQVPLTKRLIKPEVSQEISSASSAVERKKIPIEIRTTNPQKDGILCAICDKKFDSYLDVTMHLKFAHNQKRVYKCSHSNCAAGSFGSAFLLHRHEMSHLVQCRNIVGNNQNRMKCVFCRRSFNKKWNLMKHEKRHLVEMAGQ